MNENEFSCGGKTYVAVEHYDELPCTRCAFWKVDCLTLQQCGEIPYCVPRNRKDRRNVYFVEKGAQQ